jgi:Ca2+-binding RTX toxin-like protein
MIGGLGNDTYYVDNAGDVTTELSSLGSGIDTVVSTISWSLSTNVENLTLSGSAAINGTGNTLNNYITGNSADNVLNGGTGADTMVGGLGNDTYYVDNVGDVTAETSTLSTEIDTIISSVSRALGTNFENLTLSGALAIDGIGNSLDNTIIGNSAANKINGGIGADTMIGGTGWDTYYVDNAGDVVIETSTLSTEIDTVITTINNYTLTANVNNLMLSGSSALNGYGNELVNRLTGNDENNILDGGAGADIMLGGLGNDTYYVDNAGDVTTELSSLSTEIDTVISTVSRTLSGNIENLTLAGTSAIYGIGNSLDNVMIGNSAANTLNGYTGNDTLTGGGGADVFFFNSALNGTTNVDTITDFTAVDDTIRLENTYFTSLTTTGTLSAANFVASADGTAVDGNDYILYNTTTGALYYDADGNGGIAAVEFAVLGTAISNIDFIVS